MNTPGSNGNAPVGAERPRILTLLDWYLPGYKAGGPVWAVNNLVQALGNEFRFDIVTRDRDLGDREPYPGIRPDTWMEFGLGRVLYLSPERVSLAGLRAVLSDDTCSALYLNSFFSRLSMAAMALRRLGRLPSRPLIIAPRGEFAPGALSIKARRKRAYLALARGAKFCRGVIWQASSSHEARDIAAIWSSGRSAATIVETSELPRLPDPVPASPTAPKRAGTLEAVFLARICSMKNLDGALRMLRAVRSQVRLELYGPIEDAAYWAACQRAMTQLPSNIEVQYRGMIPSDRVHTMLRGKHLLLLPTHGENFGHAIFEALCAGCPVLISDRTPWRGLEERRVGWDIALDQEHRFAGVIDQVARMSAAEHRQWSLCATEYALRVANDTGAVKQNRKLFAQACRSTQGSGTRGLAEVA